MTPVRVAGQPEAAVALPAGAPVAMTAQALRGLQWTSLATVAGVVVQLLYTAAISRLLVPAAFGVVALGAILLRFASFFAQLGIGSALVQKRELVEEDVRTAFTASVLFSVGTCAVFWLLAPVGAALLHAPQLTEVARGLGLSFVLTGLGTTSLALLRRRLQFGVIAISEVISFVVGYAGVGVGLALAGCGVWSLVFASLAQSGLGSAMNYAVVRHPLLPSLDGARLWALCGFGGKVSLIGFLEFWSADLDTLVVGRSLGAGAVGQYTRATLLVVLPVHYLIRSVTKVLLPTFSRIQGETDRLARAYLGVVAVLAAVVLPVCTAIVGTAPQLVPVLLGEGFLPAVAVVPWVAAAAALTMLTHVPAVLLEARGALNSKLLIQVAHFGFMIAAVAIVSTTAPTLVSFAMAWAAAESFRQVLYLFVIARELPVAIPRLAKCYGEAVALSMVVLIATFATGRALAGGGSSVLAVLLAKGVAATLCYLAVVALRPGLEMRREVRTRGLVRLSLSVGRRAPVAQSGGGI